MLSGGAIIICFLIFVLGFMIGQSLEEQSVASTLVPENTLPEDELASGERSIDTNTLEGNQQNVISPDSSPEAQKTERSYYTVLPEKGTYVEVKATPTREETSESAAIKEPEKTSGQEGNPTQALKEETPVSPTTTQVAAAAPSLPNVPRDPSDEIRVGRQSQNQNVGLNEAIPDGTIYSVQVASSQSREDSEYLVRKYGRFGYQAYVMIADLDERGIWYRVRVSNLPSRQAANQLREELLNKIPDLAKKQPFVIKVAE